jgi:hypothetical protein
VYIHVCGGNYLNCLDIPYQPPLPRYLILATYIHVVIPYRAQGEFGGRRGLGIPALL